MATPARKPHGLPLDAVLPPEPVDETDAGELYERFARNREYLASRWADLLREHRGEWVIVYGDCQMVVGCDYLPMRNSIESGDLCVGVSKFIEEEPLLTRLW